jgi:hypothetical protein
MAVLLLGCTVTHSSEDVDFSESGTDLYSGKDDITDTDNTQRTDSRHCQPPVPVVLRFAGGLWRHGSSAA